MSETYDTLLSIVFQNFNIEYNPVLFVYTDLVIVSIDTRQFIQTIKRQLNSSGTNAIQMNTTSSKQKYTTSRNRSLGKTKQKQHCENP